MTLILEKKNQHPRDLRIKFVEEGHKYYIDGDDRYISATTFVHKWFPIFDVDKVSKQMVDTNNKRYAGMTCEEIKNKWNKEGKESAEKGSLMHLNIELFSNNEKVTDESVEFNQFLQFREDHPNLIPYRTEWTIFDTDYRIAGSIDMIYYDKNDNSYNIYDWKRTKEFKIFSSENGYYPLQHLPNTNQFHYFLQLNIYKHLLEKNYNIKIKDLYLCRCHPSNTDGYELLLADDLSDEVNEIMKIRKEQVDKNIFELELPESPISELSIKDENIISRGVCLID